MKLIGKIILRVAMILSLFLIFGEPSEDASMIHCIIVKVIALGVVFADYKINYWEDAKQRNIKEVMD